MIRRIRKQSAKRRRLAPARKRCLAAVRERSQGYCEARCHPACWVWGIEGHEKLKRSQGGSITDPENVLWICRACHNWIGDNEKSACELGLLKRRAA